MTSRPFALTDASLLEHRAGAVLALAPAARGSSYSMRPVRPALKRPGHAGAASASPPPGGTAHVGQDPHDDAEASNDAGERVSLIEIRGLLSSEVTPFACGWSDGYEGDGGIVSQVAEALADPEVAALVVDVMSPGGDAMGCGEAATRLAALRESSGKPVCVYAREACSAAYWLATSLATPGHLYVSESSDVGSIGCWSAHADYSEANAHDGVKITYLADPPGKVLGNPDEPLTEAGRSRLTRGVTEASARFAAAIAGYRPSLSTDAIRALDGDTRRGRDAVAAGLADGMAASLSEVVEVARTLSRSESSLRSKASPPMPKEPAELSKGAMSMSLSTVLARAAGFREGSAPSDAALQAALLPRLALADSAMELLAEADPVRARGKLAARIEEANGAAKLRAEHHATRRVAALERAVAAGKLRSATAWSWSKGERGEPVRAFSPTMERASAAHPEIEAWEAYLDALPALYDATVEPQPDPQTTDASAAGRGLSPKWRQLAARTGVELAAFSHNLSALAPTET